MNTVALYYTIKPFIPRVAQVMLRRHMVLRRRTFHQNAWPIDESASLSPEGWNGWPDGKQFAFVLTHDVEHYGGQFKCSKLAMIERNLGFRSSFNFVPKRYHVLDHVREDLQAQGFEVGVHDYNHDGRLFSSKKVFDGRAPAINHFLSMWNAVGFRAGAMHHNLAWLSQLNIEYDSSTFDTDPFEPQPDAARTIFPFLVSVENSAREYVELPYTLPQDFTLFVLLKEDDETIWKRKIDWIAKQGGMALVNVHPDYLEFDKAAPSFERYPVRNYIDFLAYVRNVYHGLYWHVLPKEMAGFWRTSMDQKNVVAISGEHTR